VLIQAYAWQRRGRAARLRALVIAASHCAEAIPPRPSSNRTLPPLALPFRPRRTAAAEPDPVASFLLGPQSKRQRILGNHPPRHGHVPAAYRGTHAHTHTHTHTHTGLRAFARPAPALTRGRAAAGGGGALAALRDPAARGIPRPVGSPYGLFWFETHMWRPTPSALLPCARAHPRPRQACALRREPGRPRLASGAPRWVRLRGGGAALWQSVASLVQSPKPKPTFVSFIDAPPRGAGARRAAARARLARRRRAFLARQICVRRRPAGARPQPGAPRPAAAGAWAAIAGAHAVRVPAWPPHPIDSAAPTAPCLTTLSHAPAPGRQSKPPRQTQLPTPDHRRAPRATPNGRPRPAAAPLHACIPRTRHVRSPSNSPLPPPILHTALPRAPGATGYGKAHARHPREPPPAFRPPRWPRRRRPASGGRARPGARRWEQRQP
jgi:hypothetical protein